MYFTVIWVGLHVLWVILLLDILVNLLDCSLFIYFFGVALHHQVSNQKNCFFKFVRAVIFMKTIKSKTFLETKPLWKSWENFVQDDWKFFLGIQRQQKCQFSEMDPTPFLCVIDDFFCQSDLQFMAL